jgi:hypothetical protein
MFRKRPRNGKQDAKHKRKRQRTLNDASSEASLEIQERLAVVKGGVTRKRGVPLSLSLSKTNAKESETSERQCREQDEREPAKQGKLAPLSSTFCEAHRVVEADKLMNAYVEEQLRKRLADEGLKPRADIEREAELALSGAAADTLTLASSKHANIGDKHGDVDELIDTDAQLMASLKQRAVETLGRCYVERREQREQQRRQAEVNSNNALDVLQEVSIEK